MHEWVYIHGLHWLYFILFQATMKNTIFIIITNYSIMLILIYVNISISHLNSVERFDILYVI